MTTILLTRLLQDNLEDRIYFEKKGFKTVEIPLLTLKKRVFSPVIQEKFIASQWIFLTSQHAADFLCQEVPKDILITKKIAVIGTKTGAVIRKNNYRIAFQAPFPTKKSFFNTWAENYLEPTTIFYPKSNLANKLGESALKQQGHELATPVLYDNYFASARQQQLKKYLLTATIEAVYLTSPSLWNRFFSVFQECTGLVMPKLYCVGKTTAQLIARDGYKAEYLVKG